MKKHITVSIVKVYSLKLFFYSPVSYCNFDTSMCRFVQDKRDKFDWTRRRGRTPSSRTGPSADHTSRRGK